MEFLSWQGFFLQKVGVCNCGLIMLFLNGIFIPDHCSQSKQLRFACVVILMKKMLLRTQFLTPFTKRKCCVGNTKANEDFWTSKMFIIALDTVCLKMGIALLLRSLPSTSGSSDVSSCQRISRLPPPPYSGHLDVVSLAPPYGGPLRPDLPSLTASNLSIYTTPSSPTVSTPSPCLVKLLQSKVPSSKTAKKALSFNKPPPRFRAGHRCSHR